MSQHEYYATEEFVEINRVKDTYNLVVRLAEKGKDPNHIVAYFKFDLTQNGPLAANERIVFEFAEMLDIPVTAVKFLTYDNMKGHVSYAVPGDYEIWNNLEVKFAQRFGSDIRNRIRECFLDVEPFFAMIVFDCWIANTDRHGGNFIGTMLPGNDKLSLYLIDHGHSLIGPVEKWNSMKQNEDAWYNVRLFIREPSIANLITDFSQLTPYISKIEAIDDQTIDTLVDNIPNEYLKPDEADYIKSMLKKRRNRLREMLLEWCKAEGKIKAAI